MDAWWEIPFFPYRFGSIVFFMFTCFFGVAIYSSGAGAGFLWQSTVSATGGALALTSAVTLAHAWVMEVVLFSQKHLD